MFRRPHHQRIARLLRSMNAELLAQAKCFFGGGTAIVLQLNEYRESVDIDFLCSDRQGYRLLRNAIAAPTLGSLLSSPVRHLREVRTQRDKISTYLESEGTPVRIEFVLEGRIPLEGTHDQTLGVPVLNRADMYAEKLLANTDRGLDRSQMSRDLIDLGMMIKHWGPIPPAALDKARGAYGRAVDDYFLKALTLLRDDRYRNQSLQAMAMDPVLGSTLVALLEAQPLTR